MHANQLKHINQTTPKNTILLTRGREWYRRRRRRRRRRRGRGRSNKSNLLKNNHLLSFASNKPLQSVFSKQYGPNKDM